MLPGSDKGVSSLSLPSCEDMQGAAELAGNVSWRVRSVNCRKVRCRGWEMNRRKDLTKRANNGAAQG